MRPRSDRPPSEFEVELAQTSIVRVGVGDQCGTGILAGNASFSYSSDEPAGTIEPFALNAFSAESRPPVWGAVECADGSEEEIDVRYLSVELAQPAIGARDASTGLVYFEANTLLFSIEAELNHLPYKTERFASKAVAGAAIGADVSLDEVTLEFHVPCSPTVPGTFQVRLGMESSANPTESPPTIQLNLPDPTVPCGGKSVLDADVRDDDGDLDSTVWSVDGVEIDGAVISLVLEHGSYVEVRAIDARGATTTEGQVFQCGL